MIEEMGGSYTFRWFGIVALALFALHVVVQKLMEKCACTSGKKANGDRADDGASENQPHEENGCGAGVTEVYQALPQQIESKH